MARVADRRAAGDLMAGEQVDRVEALALLRDLVEIESPTYSDGVRLVADRLVEEFSGLGAKSRRLDGDHVIADFDGDLEPVLLVGHTDTVWPSGTLESMPYRLEDGCAYGPGTYDMKGGLVVIVEALRLTQRRRAVRVFLTADEECGSIRGRPHLERAADGIAAALVLEPASPAGAVVTARRGIGRFRISIKGRPSHAGMAREEGVSAIEELAHQVLRLHEVRGASVNVGVISGGTAENVVAAEAVARIDVRVSDAEQMGAVDEILSALTPVLEGASLSVAGGWTRWPLSRTSATASLFARARDHAATLGIDLVEESSGGGSDANLLAPLGVPVLDGLGPLGDGAHARDEHLVVDSIGARAKLLARLLDDTHLTSDVGA